jgi:hypothetical protein
MHALTLDLRNPGTALAVVSLSLSVAILTAMLSIGETGRRAAASRLPPPDRDLYRVVRYHGNSERSEWPVTRDQVAAIRRVPGVLAATAHGESAPHALKHGRWHVASVPMQPVDEEHYRIIALTWGKRASQDGIVAGRDFTEEEVATGAAVCLLTQRWAALLHVEELGATVRIDGRPSKVVGFANDPPYGKGMCYLPLTADGESRAERNVSLSIVIEGDQSALRRVSSELQPIFGTADRFGLGGTREELREECARARRQLLTLGTLGAVPLAITFFGTLGICMGWVRERTHTFALLCSSRCSWLPAAPPAVCCWAAR